jgi:RNA polymerase sigma-70 factor (ECF subfamily)
MTTPRGEVPPGPPEEAGDSCGPSAADGALVRALRARATHQKAAAEILRRFGPMVSGVLRRALGADDVADLTQDVFLRFFSHAHAIDEPDALRAFLLQIAVNVVRREIRRRKLRRLVSLGRHPDPPEIAVEPEQGARELALRLQGVLATLPTRERMVFLLRYVERLPMAEVAVAVGLPGGTAKRVARRAQELVLQAFQGDAALASHLPFRRSKDEAE